MPVRSLVPCGNAVLVAGYKVKSVPAGEAGDPMLLLPQSPLDDVQEAEPCPVGFYFTGNATNVFGCVKCPVGSTTKDVGSTSVADCSEWQAGWRSWLLHVCSCC